MVFLAFNLWEMGWTGAVISWLPPFILGFLLGYTLWHRFKVQKEHLEKEKSDLNKKIVDLSNELTEMKHHKVEMESEIALIKGQLREKNLEISTLKASLAANDKT